MSKNTVGLCCEHCPQTIKAHAAGSRTPGTLGSPPEEAVRFPELYLPHVANAGGRNATPWSQNEAPVTSHCNVYLHTQELKDVDRNAGQAVD